MNKNLLIFIPVVLVLLVWLGYMTVSDSWSFFSKYWFMSVTMVFGSFIAGASSEGGGAVAFPVLTLIFKISPEVARNFSLAIQSIGMGTASLLILSRKIKVDYAYLWPTTIGGTIGIVAGTVYLAPLISPAYTKMLFVSFWLSFGLVLFYVNEVYKRQTNDSLPALKPTEKATLIIIGVLGGCLSALLGSGLDIFSFSYVTMRYHLSEKVATPTSVIIMAINAIVGFTLHLFFIGDFGNVEFNYWLVCIPVVVIGAPLGAYFISSKTRAFVARFLMVVIFLQFIGAVLILKPTGMLLIFSAIVFIAGVFFFFGFAWLSKYIQILR